MTIKLRLSMAGLCLILAFPNAGPAQAAPVQYVKICTLYGADWNYIPGTDTCVNQNTGETRKQTANGVVYGTTQTEQDAQQAKQDAQKASDSAQRANEGVALSLALPRAQVTAGHKFAAAANLGVFEGEEAFGVGGAFEANDNVTFNAALGVGLQHGTVGGNAGINVSW